MPVTSWRRAADVPNFLLGIFLRLLPKTVLGLSTTGLISALPEIKAGLSALKTVVGKLKAAGETDEGAAKAVFQMVAKKRDMNTLEEDAWANRGLSSGH